VFERQQSTTRSSESRAVAKPERAAPRANNPLLAQQRALGNQAVQRMLLAGVIQAKLTVGRPNDPYEQEADRVAETVMRMPEPEVRRQSEPSPRKDEDEDPLRAEPAAERQPRPLQRKAKGAGITHVGDAALAQRLRSPDGGFPLAAGTRAFFERRFGYDFSEVRVHDAYRDRADASALSARAFTYGKHIWLGHGEGVGDTSLLAHELTHVVQQGAAVRRKPLVAGSVAPRIQRSWLGDVAGAVGGALGSVGEAIGGAISSVGELAGAAKNRLLGQLAQWARRIPGFDLLTVILGKDPITDQPVERNAINLIRGVLGLVPGGTTMFENLQRAGVIERAFEWFSTEISKLNLTWEAIKGLFRRAWDALSITDILDPANALAKVTQIFGPTLARLRDFAVAAGRKILEFVFEGVLSLAGSLGTRVLGIIRRAGGLITTIINDPVGFLGNLIRALRGGFERFSANILNHLRTGLLEWLFGALSGAGLTLPTRFDLRGIISIVLQVLGLTYDRLRAKLVDLIGDRNVRFIEGVFDFLVTIVTGGLSAAWEKIVEFAGNLQETVIGGIRDWVARTIVGQAITRLVTMFNPVGAVIQGIMTIYNTVVFFIERAQQIAALADAVFDSISNIAAGNLGAAINYVERTMARTLPVIISFLARLIGLGGISDRIKGIIARIQAPVNRAIDRIASFIVERVRALIAGRQPSQAEAQERGLEHHFAAEGQQHRIYMTMVQGIPQVFVASEPGPLDRYIAHLRRQLPKEGDPTRGPLETTLVQLERLHERIVAILPRGLPHRTPPHEQAAALLAQMAVLFAQYDAQLRAAGRTPLADPEAVMATAHYIIGGTTGQLVAVSGGDTGTTVPSPDRDSSRKNRSRFFTTHAVPTADVPDPQGRRENDAEVKILEYLADRFGDRPRNNSLRGSRVVLHPEKEPCDSCKGVIRQFEQFFAGFVTVSWLAGPRRVPRSR
jgi:hypothetical protein